MYKFDAKIPTNYMVAFLIGFMSAYPSLMPTALSIKNNPSYDMYKIAGLEDMFISMPIFYGILHIIIFYLMNNWLPIQFRTYWFLGFIIGLLYPTFGTVTGHAKKTYGTESTFKLYLSAQLLYLLFYGLIINFIFTRIC